MKMTVKERKTYPNFVFVVKAEHEILDSSWTMETDLLCVLEMARIELGHVTALDGMVELWQKTSQTTPGGKPIYNEVFVIRPPYTKDIPLEVLALNINRRGYLLNQSQSFDSSKWYDNRLNPIQTITW